MGHFLSLMVIVSGDFAGTILMAANVMAMITVAIADFELALHRAFAPSADADNRTLPIAAPPRPCC